MSIDNNRKGSKQITVKRQKKTAECFTPLLLVEEMCRKLPKEWLPQHTFMDPAMGDGNMLIVVYLEKIRHGHDPLKALSTLHGVDIVDDNVVSCKRRLREIAEEHNVSGNINQILEDNIVWADSLKYDFAFNNNDNRAKTPRLMAKDL